MKIPIWQPPLSAGRFISVDCHLLTITLGHLGKLLRGYFRNTFTHILDESVCYSERFIEGKIEPEL